jgi:hypothetical protein
VAAQEKPKVIPVDNFARDELYPGYTRSRQVTPDYGAVDRASGRIGERRVGGKHMWTVFDLATAKVVPGVAQDIEWAIARDARSRTACSSCRTAPRRPGPPPRPHRTADRADVVASNGRIHTEPLTAPKGDDRP